MGLLKDIWDIGHDLLGLSGDLKKGKQEQKDRLADLFINIANVLTDTYDKLMQNIYPGGNCVQLDVFSQELFDKMKPVTGEDKAKALADKLASSHKVELLFNQLSNGEIEKKELMQLQETAGCFRATAAMLKV